MVTETDGIILRQTRISRDRRMIVLFTRKFGKISAGTGIRQSGKKSSLPIRPFTHGRYELYCGRNSYNIDAAETIESFYDIGEDVDRFFCASCALEFTDKVLAEGMPAEGVLDALLDFLRILSKRKKKLRSFLIMYEWKVLYLTGYGPVTDRCASCGREAPAAGFSIVDGGTVCQSCVDAGRINMRLLYSIKFDIIQILKFISLNTIDSFANLAFSSETTEYLDKILHEYVSYHLDIRGLKSESYLSLD
ncbi:MAG: DNA repair protein RecO [Anaerovoracaceae bacterium]|jgi:DNA repair protein RecO (recombination protein O)